jgi:carboxyl-terminal processing protease
MKYRRFALYIGITVILLVSLTFFGFRLYYALDARLDIYQKTKIFTEILMHIKDEYVDPIDTDILVDTAINAMIEELDPHSNYIPPKEYVSMSDRFLGYQGIGVQFRIIQNKITIFRVLSGGPSERAGLKYGDRIVKINGNDAIGLKTDDVPLLLKKPAGTRVTVTVERPGSDKLLDFTITTGPANIESIKYYYMLDDKTGYLRLESFLSTTEIELNRVIRRLEGMGMKQLVLDLRGDAGGLLPQAIDVTDKFLSGDKIIVKTKGRIASANAEPKSTDSSTDFKAPMIILIDENSASASEIVSGALQDWDRALLAGKTSFGKGLVQSQTAFEDNSALLLTIGRWYTPIGRLIQKEYTNKSRLQYRMDAMSDSLNMLRSAQTTSRPTFKTPAGRTVYGGGGITPDIDITSKYTIYYTMPVARILNSNAEDEPFLRYAEELLFKNKKTWKSVEELISSYKLEGSEYTSFLQFLKSNKFDVNESDIKEADQKNLEYHIKERIAEYLWGDTGVAKVLTASIYDNALWDAMKHFPEAEKLVKY